jgi:hypothetical protein
MESDVALAGGCIDPAVSVQVKLLKRMPRAGTCSAPDEGAGGAIKLVPENPRYPTITVKEGEEFDVWGVVTYNLHKLY